MMAYAPMMQAAALERLDASDIRDAAEKSWCATKRGTGALALARTGELAESSFSWSIVNSFATTVGLHQSGSPPLRLWRRFA